MDVSVRGELRLRAESPEEVGKIENWRTMSSVEKKFP
jgi:hypothetical protein